MNSKWFDMANELESAFRDWTRQDDELGSALASLEDCDRDVAQEQRDSERINRSREIQIQRIVSKHLKTITLICEVFFPPSQRIEHVLEYWEWMPSSLFARRRVWLDRQWYLELWEQHFSKP